MMSMPNAYSKTSATCLTNWWPMAWSKSFLANGCKFLRLPASDRGLLLQALILLPATALGLRLVGLRRWHTFLARFGPPPASRFRPPTQTLDLVHRAIRCINQASRLCPFSANCLQRALTLGWL